MCGVYIGCMVVVLTACMAASSFEHCYISDGVVRFQQVRYNHLFFNDRTMPYNACTEK